MEKDHFFILGEKFSHLTAGIRSDRYLWGGGGRNLYDVLDVPAPSARLCGMLYAQLTGTLGTVQQGHGRALQQRTAQLRGFAGACKRCGQRSVPRPEQGTELLCGSACNSLWDRKKNSEKPIRQYKTRKDKIKQKQ